MGVRSDNGRVRRTSNYTVLLGTSLFQMSFDWDKGRFQRNFPCYFAKPPALHQQGNARNRKRPGPSIGGPSEILNTLIMTPLKPINVTKVTDTCDADHCSDFSTMAAFEGCSLLVSMVTGTCAMFTNETSRAAQEIGASVVEHLRSLYSASPWRMNRCCRRQHPSSPHWSSRNQPPHSPLGKN